MPVYTIKGLPAAAILKREGVAVADGESAAARPPRVLLLNLMPQKQVTELDLLRALALAGRDIEVTLVKIAGQTYKTTPMEHMEAFYVDFDCLADGFYEGLVVTGAPVEHLPFEQVRYWPQLCAIMDWARSHVRSTLYICWGAQAALYHFYGIGKHSLAQKMFGVFSQRVIRAVPLLSGLPDPFPMPNSRHTEVRTEEFPSTPDLEVVVRSEESGLGVALGRDGREVYVAGHLEYAPETLDREYRRDLAKGLPIQPPAHYYEADDPSRPVVDSWRGACRAFYANWVRRYVAAPFPDGPEAPSEEGEP